MEDKDKTKDELIEEMSQLMWKFQICDAKERRSHKETKSLLISTLESTADGILVVDMEGKITFYNHTFVDLWRIPMSLLSMKDDSALLSYVIEQLSKPEEFIAKVKELYANPSETSYDVIEFKDGRIFERYSQPQQLDSEIIGRVWSFHDITAAKQAECKLKKSEKKYRRLVELHHAGICVFDRDGLAIYVNPAMAEMLGFTAEELIGHRPHEYMDEADVAMVPEILKELRQGKKEQLEFRFYKKDGTKLYTMVDLSPMFDESGQYEGAIAGIIDITEKRLVELELRHAQRMESIGQLAGGVAHDFNNIISSVLNYVYLIKRKINDLTPEELQDFVDEIQASAERASKLTKSLLVFSRKHAFEFTTLNLADIIDGMRVLLINLIGGDIELELNISSNEVYIHADVNQIEMLIMNLAANARDAMAGGGKLGITLQKVEPDERFFKLISVEKTQEYALLTVSDTGEGMDNRTMAKIFDPFFTTKEVGKGTGLGLSTVYGVVKQHKGYIDVKSELNKGTTFSIYIPITDNYIKNENALTNCDDERGNGCILVAEDDESLRKVTARVLMRAGYQVTIAADGEEAVKLYSENNIDLVVMDIIMPKMNGKAAYDKIISINKDAKVIFVSGYTDVYLESKLIKEEQFNYITKPLDVIKLLAMIKEIIGR
ncbi:MAG: PAS domain S-box protein [Candidatus Magnetominusculus sp. LBB02]|nr:PAS domain S-box protein [Candidatus Magnetominusculus sp. LBB02]